MRRDRLLVVLVGLLFAAGVGWWLTRAPSPGPIPDAVERGVEPTEEFVVRLSPAPHARQGAPEGREDPVAPRRYRRKPGSARTRMIRGAVYDDRGVPVAGARISSRIADEVRSDERGLFELRVANDGGLVSCRAAPGYRNRIMGTRVAPDQAYVEFILERNAVLLLRVIDANGRPVTGARVHAVDGEAIPGRTDAGGRVVLEVDGPEVARRVWVEASELDPAHPDTLFGPFRAGTEEHLLRLPEAHWIEGQVCWADGQPAVIGGGGALVEVARPGHALRVVVDASTGRFRIGPVPPGEHDLRAWWGNALTAPADFVKVPVPGEPVRLVIPDVVTFECTVGLAQNATITQAVWVAQGTACEIHPSRRTPARLRDYLPDVPGAFYVRDSEGRYAYFEGVRPGDVPATILLAEGGEISGVLVYEDLASVVFETGGVPIKGHVDLLADIDEPPFRIRGLPPGAKGTLRVIAMPGSAVLYERHLRAGTRDLRIEIELSED